MPPENLPVDLPTNAVFLPINVTRGVRGGRSLSYPKLVLVDSCRLEELQAFNWQTVNSPRPSQVYRQKSEGSEASKDGSKIKQQIRSIPLAAEVLRLVGQTNLWIDFLNGDRLDCRTVNLRALSTTEAATTPAPAFVAHGSTFSHWPAYAQALAERQTNAAQLAARFPHRGPPSRIGEFDAKVLLMDVLCAPDHFRGQPFSFFVEHLEGYFDPAELIAYEKMNGRPKVDVPLVRAVLRGECLRQPATDYKKIAELLPSRPRRPRAD